MRGAGGCAGQVRLVVHLDAGRGEGEGGPKRAVFTVGIVGKVSEKVNGKGGAGEYEWIIPRHWRGSVRRSPERNKKKRKNKE